MVVILKILKKLKNNLLHICNGRGQGVKDIKQIFYTESPEDDQTIFKPTILSGSPVEISKKYNDLIKFDKNIDKLYWALKKNYRDDLDRIFPDESTLRWIMGNPDFMTSDFNDERCNWYKRFSKTDGDRDILGKISRYVFSEYLKLNNCKLHFKDEDRFVYYTFNSKVDVTIIYNDFSGISLYNRVYDMKLKRFGTYTIILFGEMEKEYNLNKDEFHSYPSTKFLKFSDLLLDTPGLEDIKKMFNSEEQEIVDTVQNEKNLKNLSDQDNNQMQQQMKQSEQTNLINQIENLTKGKNLKVLKHREVISWCLGDTSFLPEQTLDEEIKWHKRICKGLHNYRISFNLLIDYFELIDNHLIMSCNENYAFVANKTDVYFILADWFTIENPINTFFDSNKPEDVIKYVKLNAGINRKNTIVLIGKSESVYSKILEENSETKENWFGENSELSYVLFSDLLKQLCKTEIDVSEENDKINSIKSNSFTKDESVKLIAFTEGESINSDTFIKVESTLSMSSTEDGTLSLTEKICEGMEKKYQTFFSDPEVIEWLQNKGRVDDSEYDQLNWIKKFSSSIRDITEFGEFIWLKYKQITKTKISGMLYVKGNINISVIKDDARWLIKNPDPNVKTMVFIGAAEKKFKNLCSEYPELMSEFPEITFANFTELLISFLEGEVSDEECERLLPEQEKSDNLISLEKNVVKDTIINFPAEIEEQVAMPPLLSQDNFDIQDLNSFKMLYERSQEQITNLISIHMLKDEEIEKKNLEISELKKEIVNKNNIITDKEFELSSKRTTISEYQNTMNKHISTNLSLKKEFNDKLNNLFDMMNNRSKERGTEDVEGKNFVIEKQKEVIEFMKIEKVSDEQNHIKEINDLIAENQKLKRESEATASDLVDKFNDTIDILQKRIIDLENVSNSGNVREIKLTEALEKHINHLVDIHNYNKKLYDDNQSLQVKLQEANKDADFAADYNKETVIRYQTVTGQLEQEKERLQKMYDNLETNRFSMEETLSSLKIKNTELEKDNVELREKLNSEDEQYNEILRKNLKLASQIVELTEQVTQQETTIEELRDDIQNNDTIQHNLSEDIYFLKMENTELRNKNLQLDRDLEVQFDKKNEHEEIISKFKKERVILHAEVGKISRGKNTLINELTKSNNELTETIADLQDKIKTIMKMNNSSEMENEIVKKQIEKQKENLKQVISELKAINEVEVQTNTEENLSDISLDTVEDEYDIIN